MIQICSVIKNTIKMETTNPGIKLSLLWIFILTNVIFRDIHQMALKHHLEMLLTGTYNGIEVTEMVMLMGGIVLEIPIAMIVLSYVLKRKYNRIANCIAVVIAGLLFTVEPPTDMDDVFFKIVGYIGLAVILITVIKWGPSHQSINE